MKNRRIDIILGLFLILSLAYIYFYFSLFSNLNTKYGTSSAIKNLDKIEKGYILISPYDRPPNKNSLQGKIYLLDMTGQSVHSWNTGHPALNSILKPNGQLITLQELPKYSQFFPMGGNTGKIQIIDWQSNPIWEYNNDSLHHDVSLLKNGNIAAVMWEKTPTEIAEQVLGGVPNTELQGAMWSDKIVEINDKKEIVWSWTSYEHLDPETDIIGELIPRSAWTFINGIQHLMKNPIDGEEAYLVSMRSLNTVMIIRKKDGEIIWRSPKGMLNTQHDPTLLKNGNILVYDNGIARVPNPFPFYGTRIVEINPKTNKIVWEFDGGPSTIDKARLFSAIVGGAQRLSNGNTLITDGVHGHIFEVTRDKKVALDFLSPYTTKSDGPFTNNFVFKARKYLADEINWPEKINSPINVGEYNLYKLTSSLFPKSTLLQ